MARHGYPAVVQRDCLEPQRSAHASTAIHRVFWLFRLVAKTGMKSGSTFTLLLEGLKKFGRR